MIVVNKVLIKGHRDKLIVTILSRASEVLINRYIRVKGSHFRVVKAYDHFSCPGF